MYLVVNNGGEYELFDRNIEEFNAMCQLYNTLSTSIYEITVHREIDIKYTAVTSKKFEAGVEHIRMET